MGFRFHRSIKLPPGIRLNFGKRGINDGKGQFGEGTDVDLEATISASIGVRGAHVTYGPAASAAGITAFVQIWAEPCCDLIVEVGPGNRDDEALQAFADGVRAALEDRGFEIGGNADNFRKTLPRATEADSPRVARELLPILMDVLGYDGSNDLAYKVHQGSHLSAAHVVTGLGRSALQTYLTSWGLRARPSSDAHILEVSDLHLPLQVHLYCPHPQRKGDFWEVHCLTMLTLDQKNAAALCDEVNGKPHLMKAFVCSDPGEAMQPVRLSLGINLAGGVALDHVRCQIFEFLSMRAGYGESFNEWFERLTGFTETTYDDTRRKLAVDLGRLRSVANDRTYGVGTLELVSLHDLRERVQSGANPSCGRLKVRLVSGDVRRLHASPGLSGALFQVASQFNLLEMISPEVTPEQGVTGYETDKTQGPACAIAAGAATIYRNYFAPVGEHIGQTSRRQLDGLADVGTALVEILGKPLDALWTMRNGSCPLRTVSIP